MLLRNFVVHLLPILMTIWDFFTLWNEHKVSKFTPKKLYEIAACQVVVPNLMNYFQLYLSCQRALKISKLPSIIQKFVKAVNLIGSRPCHLIEFKSLSRDMTHIGLWVSICKTSYGHFWQGQHHGQTLPNRTKPGPSFQV